MTHARSKERDAHAAFLDAGAPWTIVYRVRNDGPLAVAFGVTLTVDLTGAHTFDAATPSQGTCLRSGTPDGSLVACDLGDVALGSPVSVTIVVTAPDPLGGHLSVNAVASGSDVDPDTDANVNSTQAIDIVTRDDMDPEDSFGTDLDGDGVHDRITVGTQGGATVAGTDDIDNDPKDKEVIVLDPNQDPNGSMGYDLDGDGDVDVVVIGTKGTSGVPQQLGNYAADDVDQEIAILDGSLAPDGKLTIDVDNDGDTDVIFHGANGPVSPPPASCANEHVLVHHLVEGAETYQAVDSLKAGYAFEVGPDSMLALLTSPGGRVALYPGFRVAVGGSLAVSTDGGACLP